MSGGVTSTSLVMGRVESIPVLTGGVAGIPEVTGRVLVGRMSAIAEVTGGVLGIFWITGEVTTVPRLSSGVERISGATSGLATIPGLTGGESISGKPGADTEGRSLGKMLLHVYSRLFKVDRSLPLPSCSKSPAALGCGHGEFSRIKDGFK